MTFLRLRRPRRPIVRASLVADNRTGPDAIKSTWSGQEPHAPDARAGMEAQVRSKRAILAAVAALMIIGVSVLPALAEEPPPPILGEPLTGRAVFVDDIGLKIKIAHHGGETTVVNTDDPSATAVVRYTVQPGAQFPWHTHRGPVVVNVVSGALTYIDAEDCAEQTYTAGQAFVDAGHGHAHSAINRTGSPTVLMATFFEAPATGSLLIPVEPADC
jgi:quercetin dioxygenase-like cupin family protein